MRFSIRAFTEEEEQTIKKWSHSRTEEARLVQRAKILFYAKQGKSVKEIAQIVDLGEVGVRRWVKMFNEKGLEGLRDALRFGRPVTYDPEVKAEVIATALRDPQTVGLPFGSWTYERLAIYLQETKGIQMKKTRIFEILHEEGLRWRQQETWFGERVDPDFAKKRGPLKP